MNSSVPVIGPKVTVVGSKVTEMLKRKLQQRLLAEKAKKVRTSSSEDEHGGDPGLQASGNVTVTTTSCGASSSSAEQLMSSVHGMASTSSCPGSVGNMNSVFIHNGFIMQNNSQTQNAMRTSLDANKNKVSKPKNSKSKKCPKAPPAAKCVVTVGVDAGASSAGGAIVHGVTCSDGTANRNLVTCSMNNAFNPELRKINTSITFNNTVAQPLHLTSQQNGASFTNGFYSFHPGLHKSNFVVNCDDKKLGFPSGMFVSGCAGKVSNACNSTTTDGVGEALGSVVGTNMSTGDYDNCLLPTESRGDDVMEIPLGNAAKTGIAKDTAADGDDVHKLFPDGQGIGSKKSSTTDQMNPSLIDSSLWPLIYGENSKQLDDYIHRIYCRDCQKSQEQRPLGERGDGDRQTLKNNNMRGHSEVNKCQLQHLKDVNEANLCGSVGHQCNGENTEMVLPPTDDIGDVLTSSSGQTTPSTQFQDRMALNLFQEQSSLPSLSGADDGLNLDISQSLILDASRKASDKDNEASSSSKSPASSSSTNFVNSSTSMNLGDTRSAKSSKKSNASKAVLPKASSNKVIKFHEYKGPPNVSRPTCSITMPPAVRSPPLKDDLFQKLQQRQLCLQMQLQLEFRNRGLLASLGAGSHRLSSSCDVVGKIGQQMQMNGPARSSLGVAEKMCMEAPVGQPAVAAQVTFSSPAAAAAAAVAMGNGKTPILLQSMPSVMASPSKFVLPVGAASNSLQPSGIPPAAAAALSVTTAGSQCITASSSSSSSSSSPSSLLMMSSSSSSAASSPSSSSVGGAFTAASTSSSVWPGCQSVQQWNHLFSQSDKTPDTPMMKPVTESAMPNSGWQHHLMVTSSTSCGTTPAAAAVSSVCHAVTSQSAAALVASAMTSAPILYASGKVLPNQAAALTPNASKTKVSVGCSASSANRSNTVVIPTRLEDVKVADLKAECRKRKLVVSGPKPNLIERLRPYEDDILHCLAVNLRATLHDAESTVKEEKSTSSTNMADQTSSPSSLTSMDSVVNIQPLCHLNDDDSSAGEMCLAEEKTDMTGAAVRSSSANVCSDQLMSAQMKQSLASSNIRNHVATTMSQTPPPPPLSLSISPTHLPLSVAAAASGSSQPSHCHIPPMQFIANSIGGLNIPSSSSLGSLNFATPSPAMELAAHRGSSSMASSADQPVAFASSSRLPPSMSFALPSVSQWYRMPSPMALASIPVSNPSLPAAHHPALRFFPPTCFVATPSSATMSMCQPTTMTMTMPAMNAAAFRCHNPLSSSPFAIPLPSTACLTNPCPGHALMIQSTTSPRPSIQSVQVSTGGAGKSPGAGQTHGGPLETNREDFNNQKDNNHLNMISSPTGNPSTAWPTICHSKLDASSCGSSMDMNGVISSNSNHLIQPLPSEIISSSDLLSWQQQQIMELQKQLHLSRMQLIETHRRVWEQQEQFQQEQFHANLFSAAPQGSALVAYAGGAPQPPSSLVNNSRNTMPIVVDRNSTLGDQVGFQCDALQDIPKLGEEESGGPCDDVTHELFEDFAMGLNPLTGEMKELEQDMSCCDSSPGLDDFGDSACAEMLSKDISDQESIDISQLAKTFLSPGIETCAHSMLDMCSLGGGSDVSTDKTSSSRDNIPDLLSPAGQQQSEERDNGSFYLSVPLKEPPKYDDVVKGKQNSSSSAASASSVAMASSSVDDLLQMLMRQTDMLVNTSSISDHVLSSGSDILTNTSPLTFTSPMSHSGIPVDDLTAQELDVYPYSAGSNSSSGISTAPSTCGDLLSDPLSSSGMSTSMFSEIPFQLPDWTDSEFLELSMLGRMKLDQTEGVSSATRAQHGTPDIPMVLPPLSSAMNMASKAAAAPASSNDYDPCLAGFGPSYLAADSLGLTDLLDVNVPSLPPSDMANVSRSYDVLEDLFIMEEDDLFHIRDPASYLIADRRLGVSSISRN